VSRPESPAAAEARLMVLVVYVDMMWMELEMRVVCMGVFCDKMVRWNDMLCMCMRMCVCVYGMYDRERKVFRDG